VLRVWIACAAVVGLLVAGLLVWTREEPPKPAPRRPQARPTLTESDVRTYIAVQPEMDRLYKEMATRFQQGRVDGSVDPQAIGQAIQARRNALLASYHLSPDAWTDLSERVEYVVEVVRAEKSAAARKEEIEKQLALKRDLLKLAAEESRPTLQADIDKLERDLAWEGPPLHEADRELVLGFWSNLSQLAPTRGPPPKGQ